MIRRVSVVAALLCAATPAQQDWPHWRGPLGTGSAPDADPPIQWSEKKNIRWKVAVPGAGHASPIVAGDRVFVLTAIPFGDPGAPVPDDAPGAHDNAPVTRKQEWAALAFDRKTGKKLWHTAVHKGLPHAGAHVSGTLASASPVTDGEHLWASFGSVGVFCLTVEGEVRWQKDLGDMQVKHGHGEGSSPVLAGDHVVVNWDHQGDSFIVALDKKTGEERWRAARSEPTSWTSPVTAEVDGKLQVIVSGTTRIRGYDADTGEVVWECRGLSNNVVASPVVGHGIAIAGSSYEKRVMRAIRLAGAKGDVTETDHLAWSKRRRTPYVPSPLLHGDHVWFLSHYQNVLSRVHVKTGEEPTGPFRVGGLFDIYASPVAAKDRIYVTDREGTTVVFSCAGTEPKFLAANELDDRISASAALAGGEFYLRGETFLYCIATR